MFSKLHINFEIILSNFLDHYWIYLQAYASNEVDERIRNFLSKLIGKFCETLVK